MKKVFTLSNVFLVCCVIVTTVLAIVYSSAMTWLIWVSTIFGILSSKWASDGKWMTFVFDIISYGIYIYICLEEKYFGELILSVLIIIFHFFTLFEWKHNQIKKHVKINSLSKLEMAAYFGGGILITFVYAIILYFMKSDLPLLNAMSTIIYLLAGVFCFRRSILQFHGWIGYSIVFMILWIMSAIGGNMSGTIFLVGALSEVVYAIIGIASWKKVNKLQNEKQV